MPPFFLHVRVGVHLIVDPDGSCLPALAAAKTKPVLSARELMSPSTVEERRRKIEGRFEIADYDSKSVARVPFWKAVR